MSSEYMDNRTNVRTKAWEPLRAEKNGVCGLRLKAKNNGNRHADKATAQ